MSEHEHHHHHGPHDHHHHHHHDHPGDDGRWLAMDVGAGTQDILIYEPGRPLEACGKLVLPAPTVVAAGRIRAAAQAGRAVWLHGRVMGGGAVTAAVEEHLKAGLKVFAQAQAALTLHDDLKRVQAMGVALSEEKPPDTSPVFCGDVDPRGLSHALEHFGISLPANFALAAQDHGFHPEGQARQARFLVWEEWLQRGGDPAELFYDRPPAELTRLQALAEALPHALVADSASAILLGAIQDEFAAAHLDQGLTALNVGNGHTVAWLVRGKKVLGIYEHHTGLLTPTLLADHLARFRAGRLPNQEILDQGGHGCLTLAPGEYPATVVTGPKRALAAGLGRPAVVHGDMMLAGCFGLLLGARLAGRLE